MYSLGRVHPDLEGEGRARGELCPGYSQQGERESGVKEAPGITRAPRVQGPGKHPPVKDLGRNRSPIFPPQSGIRDVCYRGRQGIKFLFKTRFSMVPEVP